MFPLMTAARHIHPQLHYSALASVRGVKTSGFKWSERVNRISKYFWERPCTPNASVTYTTISIQIVRITLMKRKGGD